MSSTLLCIAAKAADVHRVNVLTDAAARLDVTDKVSGTGRRKGLLLCMGTVHGPPV